MCLSSHTYFVEVPGIDIAEQSTAEADIRRLTDIVAGAADEKGVPFLLQRIRLTGHFENEANQLLQERSGIDGYKAERDNAHAIAKTLWTRSAQGDFGFTVLINANVLGNWSLTNPRCLTTVLHELCHVFYEGIHLKRIGEEEYTAVGDTRERCLDRWATLLIDEFDVDRLVDRIVHGIATKADGQPWSLRELEEVQGVDWVQGLLDRLSHLPEFVDGNVWQYQSRRMKIEDLYALVVTFVKDILTLVSHTAAIYIGTERWPETLRSIKNTVASQRFFGEHLDTFLGQLDSIGTSYEESLRIVEQAIEEIFRNCGLSFETTPQGLYVAVTSPSK